MRARISILAVMFLALLTSSLACAVREVLPKPVPHRYPGATLFNAHCEECDQCSGRVEGEEGPSPLCEVGFELLQQDIRNQQ